MPPKRAAKSSATAGAPPLVNALLVGTAIAAGLGLLVSRGRLDWPPQQLLASVYTVAGCLALVGPIVLVRGGGESGDGSLGELLWMSGGILAWVYNALAVLRGEWQTANWATPIGSQAMGLTMLAILLAGWRCGLAGRNWSWTNVVGWLLGLYWVGMALWTLWPARRLGASG